MRLVLSLILITRTNSITPVDLFASRLRQLDPQGERHASMSISGIIKSYNELVVAPREAKPSYDIYDAILYTILCGISTQSTSNGSDNRCLRLHDHQREASEEVLTRVFGLAYKRVNFPVVYPYDLARTRPSNINSRNYGQRYALIKAKLSDNASKDPRPITFDELAKTWNDLLSLENPDIPDNNTIIYGLMILNSTGMDIPIHHTRRKEIMEPFCILFKGQSISRRKPNLIDECTSAPQPQNVAEYKLAETALKHALLPLNPLFRIPK